MDNINTLVLAERKLYRLTFQIGHRVHQVNVMAEDIEAAANFARNVQSITFSKEARLVDCEIIDKVEVY